MMATSSFAVMLGWIPLLAGLPIGLPPLGIPPGEINPLLVQVAPEQCLFYSVWAPVETPDPNSANETEKLLAEPEVQRAIQRLETELRERLTELAQREDDRAAGVLAQLAPRLARAALLEGGAAYVEDLILNRNGPPRVKAALMIGLGDSREEIIGLIASLVQTVPQLPEAVMVDGHRFLRLVPQAPLPEITWGEWQGFLVIGFGADAVQQLVERSKSPAPEWLQTSMASFDVPRRATFSHINLAGVRERILQIATPAAPAMLTALGLGNVQSLVTVTGLDETGFVSHSRLALDGAPQGMLSLMAGEPLTPGELEGIPADAVYAAAMRLDLGQGLKQIEASLTEIEPRAAEQFRFGIEQFNQALGFNLETDLLDTLGSTWCLYTSPNSGGLVGGWTASVAVRNPQRLKETLGILVRPLRSVVNPDDLQLRTTKVGEQEISFLSIDGLPYAPAWCVTDSELVIGLFPQAVAAHIVGRGERSALVKRPEVAAAFQGERAPVLFSYVDMQAVFDMVYPLLQLAAQSILADMQRDVAANTQIDISLLPPASVIRPHLKTAISTTTALTSGFQSTKRQSLPGGSLTASAPLTAALLLPAVQSSRTAAMRMRSMNNLKQLGLAMHNYHDTFGGFPAAYSTDKEGKPLLSWRVYVLPFVEQQALFEQFHLDEPWDSEHNKKLIAKMPDVFRSPTSKAEPGKTVYLTPRAGSTVFPEPERPTKMEFPTGIQIQDVTDGTSNTVMLIEVSDDRAVFWTQPDDFEFDPLDPLAGAIGQHREGVLVGFADGSVRLLSKMLDAGIVHSLFTRNGGEAVPVGAIQ